MSIDKNVYFISSVEQLTEFLKKIKDLTSINQRVIMRIDNENILLLSFVGDSFKDIHAFKNYIFPINQILTIKKGELTEPVFFISRDGKSLYNNLKNMLDYTENIQYKMSIDDDNYVNYIKFNNKKLEINITGSDSISIGSEISIDDINNLMNIDMSLFNFRIDKLDFLKIKKMGLIGNEPKSVLYINIENKKLYLGETKWRINIDNIDYENIILSFPKSYFNTMNPDNFIDVYVFEEFILCKYDDYNLMILMETTV